MPVLSASYLRSEGRACVHDPYGAAQVTTREDPNQTEKDDL